VKIPIRLRPQVVDDLTQAADWYNQKRAALGNEFIEEAYRAFDVLSDRAESFPLVRNDVRRALMKRFPYAIYFRRDVDAVTLLLVVHTARAPRVVRKRLR
jgi:toxin ParE1/3/4